MKKALRFAEEHESWMQDKLKDLAPSVTFQDGVSIPVLGHERIIDIHHDPALKRTDIKLTDTHLEVRTNQSEPQGRITRFLKKLAKEELTKTSAEKAQRIGKNIKSISIRDTKSRWGSCSHDGHLSFSWRLIFAPYEAFDYVAAHEVAHLEHLDHSKAFWSLCRDLSDDFVEGEYWMKNHGQELMRYGA